MNTWLESPWLNTRATKAFVMMVILVAFSENFPRFEEMRCQRLEIYRVGPIYLVYKWQNMTRPNAPHRCSWPAVSSGAQLPGVLLWRRSCLAGRQSRLMECNRD